MEFWVSQKTVFIPEEQAVAASQSSLLKASFHQRQKISTQKHYSKKTTIAYSWFSPSSICFFNFLSLDFLRQSEWEKK